MREPSVVATNKDTGDILAIGEEARRMLGRTPGNIVATRPLREGVIADYDTTEIMLRYFIRKACNHRRFVHPRVLICIPVNVTTVEERAVKEAAIQSGARRAYTIEEPLAAALGAGLDISGASGNMVVDIGGGTTDIAVLSLGGIVVSQSLRMGGDKFDEAIVRHIKREYNIMIGERTAEEMKIRVATADPDGRREIMDIRGRDLVTGLPKTISVSSVESYAAIQEPVAMIVEAVKSVLERTPPELASDIIDKGIVMTGGGSLLFGLDHMISKHTGIPVYVADDPLACVALGTGKALDCMDKQGRLDAIMRRAL